MNVETPPPQHVCPLCSAHALAWSTSACACDSCGAVFDYNAPSNTLFYTLVPAEFESLAAQLTDRWLHPRELVQIIERQARIYETQAPETSASAVPSGFPRGLVLMAGLLATAFTVLCAGIGGFALLTDARITRESMALQALPAPAVTVTVARAALLSPLASPSSEFQLAFASPIPPAQAPPTSPPSPTAVRPAAGTALVPSLVQTANVDASATAAASRPVPPSPALVPTTPALTSPIANTQEPFTPAAVIPPPTFTPVPPSNTPVPDTPSPTPPVTSTPDVSATTAARGTQTSTPLPSVTVTATQALSASVTPVPSPTPTATVAPTRTLVITHVKFQGDADKDETNEFIELRNASTTAISLNGWKIWSRSKIQSFNLPATLTMFAGDICRFYSGGSAGGTASPNSNCPKQDLVNPPPGGNVWGPGDIAELRDPADKTISACTYGAVADTTIHDAVC